jgi:hypothetical protein
VELHLHAAVLVGEHLAVGAAHDGRRLAAVLRSCPRLGRHAQRRLDGRRFELVVVDLVGLTAELWRVTFVHHRDHDPLAVQAVERVALEPERVAGEQLARAAQPITEAVGAERLQEPRGVFVALRRWRSLVLAPSCPNS